MASPVTFDVSAERIVLRKGRHILLHKSAIRSSVKPIVKWPGGKQWLANAAPHLLPPSWSGHYYEPFVGGGALFFALEPARGNTI